METSYLGRLGVDDWPVRGQTPDKGVGSRAVSSLRDLTNDQRESVPVLYEAVHTLLRDYDDEVKQAVLLSAASNYSLEALLSRTSNKPGNRKKIDDEVWGRVFANASDDEKINPAKLKEMFDKTKQEIQMSRRASRNQEA